MPDVLPAEALEHFKLATIRRDADRGQPRPMRDHRLVCRALVRDSGASMLLDGLTPARPLPGVNLALFGG